MGLVACFDVNDCEGKERKGKEEGKEEKGKKKKKMYVGEPTKHTYTHASALRIMYAQKERGRTDCLSLFSMMCEIKKREQ